MFSFPKTEAQLKARISSYKSAMMKEEKSHGSISDGRGKRYLLFSLYSVLNDSDRSRKYIEWYQKEFSDDTGEPIQKLCWALMLHRLGEHQQAKQKLADLMLSNLYFIPQLLGKEVKPIDMWHSSNLQHADYIEYLPDEVIKSIKPSELQWMRELYDSPEFLRLRKRYIEIYQQLKVTEVMEDRAALVKEAYSLLDRFSVV